MPVTPEAKPGQKLNSVLGVFAEDREGVRFKMHEVILAEPEQVDILATRLLQFPGSAVKITGYSEAPGGKWQTKALASKLALLRAQQLRKLLQDVGVGMTMACEGPGHKDSYGPRCVVTECSEEDAQRIESETFLKESNSSSQAQRSIDELLLRGIIFEPGYAKLKEESKDTITAIADVMAMYPEVGYKIVGFTGRPGHVLTPTQDICKELSVKRAAVVKDLIIATGIQPDIFIDGMGHADERGPRLEFTCVDLEEAMTASQAELALRNAKSRPASVLEIVFEPKGGGDLKYISFHKKPLGMVLGSTMPLKVAGIDPNGYAKGLGVKPGMTVRMINCKSIASMNVDEAMGELNRSVEFLMT